MNTKQGGSPMIKLMINTVFRILAIFLSGVVLALLGFLAGSNFFIRFGLEFNGRQGYEAGGPIGFLLGALIGLIASSVFLFRKRAAK